MPKIEGRVCGTCTACCKTHAVFSINKPPGKWCTHCNIGQGCLIYETRPQGCQDFQCEWLKGYGREEDRPDRSKIVLDLALGGALETTLMIWEVSPGAIDRPLSEEAAELALRNNVPVGRMMLSGKYQLLIPTNLEVPPELLTLKENKMIEIIRV